MSGSAGPSIQTSDLVFDYDMSNTQKSFKGPPATDRIVSTPLTLTVYAYATGPVSTANIIDATYQPRTVSRYTISNNINTARAMVTSSGLTTGVSYTFSCKIKYNGGNTATPSFAVDASKGNPEGGSNNNTVSSSVGATTSLGNGWYYVTYTWSYSACPTSGCYLTYGVVTGADATYVGNTFDIYEPQFEIGSFATPYVTQSNGIRSNTQAIIDLTNKNTITASSLAYNSDGTFTFAGGINYLTLSSLDSLVGDVTLEAAVNLGTRNGPHQTAICTDSDYQYGIKLLASYHGNMAAWIGFGSTNYIITAGSLENAGNAIIACTRSSTTGLLSLYLNGVLVASGTGTTGNMSSSGSGKGRVGIEYHSGGYGFNGKIYFAKAYNRTLSAAEIQQNFNALRTRYGI